MEKLINELFNKNSFGFGEYDRENLIKDILKELEPKSLQGIENNNGWIKIESEADLPKQDCNCYFILKSNNAILTGKFNQGCFDYALRYYDHNDITHYQPIKKPNPPIY